MSSGIYCFGEFILNTKRMQLFLEHQPKRVQLTPKALKLLKFLVENKGTTFSSDQIHKNTDIWKTEPNDLGSAKQLIYAIKNALKDSKNEFIETTPILGYCFKGKVTEITEEEFEKLIAVENIIEEAAELNHPKGDTNQIENSSNTNGIFIEETNKNELNKENEIKKIKSSDIEQLKSIEESKLKNDSHGLPPIKENDEFEKSIVVENIANKASPLTFPQNDADLIEERSNETGIFVANSNNDEIKKKNKVNPPEFLETKQVDTLPNKNNSHKPILHKEDFKEDNLVPKSEATPPPRLSQDDRKSALPAPNPNPPFKIIPEKVFNPSIILGLLTIISILIIHFPLHYLAKHQIIKFIPSKTEKSLEGKVIFSPEGKIENTVDGKVVISSESKIENTINGKVVISSEGKIETRPEAHLTKGEITQFTPDKIEINPEGKITINPEGKITINPQGKIEINPQGKIEKIRKGESKDSADAYGFQAFLCLGFIVLLIILIKNLLKGELFANEIIMNSFHQFLKGLFAIFTIWGLLYSYYYIVLKIDYTYENSQFIPIKQAVFQTTIDFLNAGTSIAFFYLFLVMDMPSVSGENSSNKGIKERFLEYFRSLKDRIIFLKNRIMGGTNQEGSENTKERNTVFLDTLIVIIIIGFIIALLAGIGRFNRNFWSEFYLLENFNLSENFGDYLSGTFAAISMLYFFGRLGSHSILYSGGKVDDPYVHIKRWILAPIYAYGAVQIIAPILVAIVDGAFFFWLLFGFKIWLIIVLSWWLSDGTFLRYFNQTSDSIEAMRRSENKSQ